MGHGFFRRFFEDYSEARVPDAQGKMHTQRVYQGFFYIPHLTRMQYVLRSIVLVMMTLSGIGLFIDAASRPTACNTAWYVAISTGLSLIALLILLIPLCSCAFGGLKQTVYQYKSGSRQFIRWSWIAGGCMALTAILSTFACLMAREHLLPAILFLFASVLVAGAGIIERCVRYDRTHNPAANGELSGRSDQP